MNLTVEKLEKNMAKLTVEVGADVFEAAIKTVYNKQKNQISVPGFRKGKVPQAYLEKMYGAEMFYEDAANEVISNEYPKVFDETELEIVSSPEVEVIQAKKGEPFIFAATVAVKPEVTLGQYKDIEVEVEKAEVTDEEVEAELKKEQEQNKRTFAVEDRAVVSGDEVMIDYEGFVDGTAFQGGKGEDYPLVIGSHSFIDTFEDQLIGKNIGDEVEVNVTFPEEYHAPELAGKPAMFKVNVKGINASELPELNDEFAQDVGGFDTLDEYKNVIKTKLAEKKEKEAKAKKEDKVMEKVVENATMDIPEAMITTTVKQMVDEFAQRLSYQGLRLEQYFQFTGLNMAKFEEQCKPQALARIQSRLVLEKIVEVENITVTDEELDAEIANMASMYQMEAEKIKELMGDAEKDAIKKDTAVQKALDFVVTAAKEV